ncbi:DUF5753 domain-containing protein [Nocardia sp. NPDC004068]|uniref:DUF5753 domain-containing protein n=1 Tax=Nocardia sp. NPDC004068 TaxID=3364303 RepID=UPI00368DD58D
MTAWRILRLPTIVQTPDYCRAVAWAAWPNLPTERIEERVARSLNRRGRLDDPDFTAEIIVSEAAIREEWGGPGVMDEQRRYLVAVGRRPNVSVRVVPFDARSHIGGLVGEFSLMEFPMLAHSRLTEPPIVHIEEYAGNLYLERPEEICRYEAAIAELRRVALDESDSGARILAALNGGYSDSAPSTPTM